MITEIRGQVLEMIHSIVPCYIRADLESGPIPYLHNSTGQDVPILVNYRPSNASDLLPAYHKRPEKKRKCRCESSSPDPVGSPTSSPG